MFCLHQRQFCSTLIGVDVCEWVCTCMGMCMMYICVHTWGGHWVMLGAPIYQSLNYLLRQGSYGNPALQNWLNSLTNLSCRPACLFLLFSRFTEVSKHSWLLGIDAGKSKPKPSCFYNRQFTDWTIPQAFISVSWISIIDIDLLFLNTRCFLQMVNIFK